MKTTVVYFAHYQKFAEYDQDGNLVKDGKFFVPEKKEVIIEQDNATIVFLDDDSKGVSQCHPNDNPKQSVGRKLAYFRAKILSLQKEIRETLKNTH